MQKLLSALRGVISRVRSLISPLWKRYRSLRPRNQLIGAVLLGALVIAFFAIIRAQAPEDAHESLRAVTLRSVGELSGSSDGGTVFGTVRSVSEGTVLAEASGSVTRVNAAIGESVPAGFILAELENASEAAAYLQAEGVYEAALAARSSTDIDGFTEYRNAFATLDEVIETEVDLFFSGRATDPNLNIIAGGWESQLNRDRAAINDRMTAWRRNVSAGTAGDPSTLLSEAQADVETIALFLNDLFRIATRPDSGASDEQLAALASARSSVSAVASAIDAASASYNAGTDTSKADAQVKQALGALRAAGAALEKTRLRAPISGTVNFLPIRTGDYVSQGTHVGTVAQNGALEAVAFVSEATRDALTIGMEVSIDGTAGTITAIAPALDPVTKQIEVRAAVTGTDTELTNGASVEITLPGTDVSKKPAGPLTLPLSSVKLRANDRVVFGVNEESRLVAYLVETGTVRGDRIEIATELPPTLIIVSDARGLAEGERVNVLP